MSAIVATSVLAAPVLAAKPATELKPFSKWNVQYEDDSCRLLRSFGEGDASVIAIFEKFAPSDFFRLTLAGKPLKRYADRGGVEIAFGSSEPSQKLEYVAGNFGKDLPAIFINPMMRVTPLSRDEEKLFDSKDVSDRMKIALIEPARLAAVKEIDFGRYGNRDTKLVTGSMKAPLAALDKCTFDLMKSWGIDTERHRNLKVAVNPLSSPALWMRNEDYPDYAKQNGEQGIVNFRLSVDETGKATACHIQQSTRSKEFDALVCKKMMMRAKFSPALDSEGKPLASYYRNSVRFVM